MSHAELLSTIKAMVVPGKGILAADESTPTIGKRFATINTESTEESRRDYRELLFTTPGMEEHINGVILFEETLGQSTKAGEPFSELLAKKGVVPGIKVDKGVRPLPFSEDEKFTQGLDGLGDRLETYKAQGARFAKWRAVLNISDVYPSTAAMQANAEGLANYAAICQQHGIVPIVEPELLMDGTHTIETCRAATHATLQTVFEALYKHNIFLEGMMLKPSMVISGSKCTQQADVKTVAEETLSILRRTVPSAVPSINFLSGGQSDDIATAHLNAMNQSETVKPWLLSFSYGRALQAEALKTWGGKASNVEAAQQAFLKHAKSNGAACLGACS